MLLQLREPLVGSRLLTAAFIFHQPAGRQDQWKLLRDAPVDRGLLYSEADIRHTELPGVGQRGIVGDEVGSRRIDRFAMDRNRVGQIPCDHSRLGVAIGRAAMLDRHALNPAGKVQRPGHGVGIGRIHALDDFHFLRREIFVPAELFEHAQSELWISVLDFRANRIGTLREKIVVVLPFDLLPVLHHLALDDALDTEPGAEGAAALLHGKIGVVKDRRARMLELRRSPAWPR